MENSASRAAGRISIATPKTASLASRRDCRFGPMATDLLPPLPSSSKRPAASRQNRGDCARSWKQTQDRKTDVLKLVADAPIKGRIVNIDGRPVAGGAPGRQLRLERQGRFARRLGKESQRRAFSAVDIQRPRLIDTLVRRPAGRRRRRGHPIRRRRLADLEGAWQRAARLGSAHRAGNRGVDFPGPQPRGQTLQLSLNSARPRRRTIPAALRTSPD